MDYIKVSKVNAVQLEKGQSTFIGTLHLTAHHMIFSHPDREIWISYPTIHTVEKGLPTVSNVWPLHIRCHNFVFVALNFQSEKDVTDVYESIQKLTCIGSVEQLYAFYYKPSPPFSAADGWQIYDPLLEYERMGVGSKNDQWRFSDINQSFSILVVPSKISDTVLTYAAKHRSKARIPALSYLHWNNMASITRSSQPMVGLKQNRSIQDEKLIESIFLTNAPQSSTGHPIYGNTPTNLIIDARPTANAVANTAVGAGTENMENYRNCKKIYSGIENIHVMRDSLNKLVEALQEIDTRGSVSRSALQKSGWLKYIGAVMDGALMIVRNIHVCNSHVLVHCSDGWDRTAQLTSVAQICLDPYYRTLRGFQVLIEKEWCSFGYKFMDRCGHLSNDKNFVALSATNSAANTFANVQSKFYNNKHIRETSPIFHQFLDCVFQTMSQHPTRFEFNEYFLTQLHYHVYSCQFGNFLFNCEKDRRQYMASTKCTSIWDFINSNKDEYLNKDYDPKTDKVRGGDGGVLFPDTKAIKYWALLFGRTDDELNSVEDNTNSTANNPMSERMTPDMLGLGSGYDETAGSADAEYLTDQQLQQRADMDPLGIGSGISSPAMSRPRSSSARTSNIHQTSLPDGMDDSLQKTADSLASKLPAALSGGLNWFTTNVRETWYASGPGSSSLLSSNGHEASASPFADMRSSSSASTPPGGMGSQHRAATVGRSNSSNTRRRPNIDRELMSITSMSPGTNSTATSHHAHSATSSPKHSLADLTLEHEMNSSYPYLGQDRDPLRSGGTPRSALPSSPSSNGSSSGPLPSSRPGSSNRHPLTSNSTPSSQTKSATPQPPSPEPLKTLPTNGAVEAELAVVAAALESVELNADAVEEQVRESVKELPHPLFVE
ncbi:hypothetical protein BGZ70_008160 [Mortierella alpina]|uniref:Myotubularin phosphatase domain-containing protein n=1 Tax=Mortierella alpina TaxID=64518 RepID=A0A9P6J439_MORAP|nr:hypothetical protein BGZ70_008160 [Mortierella alpina]